MKRFVLTAAVLACASSVSAQQAAVDHSAHMAFSTIFFETTYPLALFSRRLRPVMVMGGIGLILGIRALMGPTFENFLLINLFWVPWDRVEAWIRARISVLSAAPPPGASSAATSPVAVAARSEHLTEVR